ncbi:MAG: preprotein translocase subunit SecE [Thermodesulfatator sp.]|nr:MAG: preprotein translocase subunit SecE [Thermodesulfatator sp.]
MAKTARAKRKVSKPAGGKVASLKELRERGKVAQAVQFLKEVRVEFKKITWASRKQTLATTAAVLSFTLFVAFYLGLVDVILSKIVQWLVY